MATKSHSLLPEGFFCFATGAAPVLDLQVSFALSLVAMASAIGSRIMFVHRWVG
jgi:hypothetical protein